MCITASLLFQFAVAVDSTTSDVYVTGYVGDGLDGQMYAGGLADIAVLKYDAAGVRQWTRLMGSSGTDRGYGGETNNSY